ncbi:MAG: Ribosomal RNA small subunit methyltransferase D [Pelotomaculum sp. PtaU1.Bin035]|nr:MAG: Ribosomal RNA small subunit methyltransferase D [Pelotomaculum sp. PtaU1.Bin035]
MNKRTGSIILRVIAGIAKKRQLKSPRGVEVRPTSGRVKEALFNILGPLVEGSNFLDLFAGTGNVGIEALSRGAERTVFVEKSVKNVRIIKENLDITGLEANARLVCLSVNQALPLLGREGLEYDLIFIDPPYHKDLVSDTLNGIVKNGLLKPGGTVVIESGEKDLLPRGTVFLRLFRQEKYGDTFLSFYHELTAGEGK